MRVRAYLFEWNCILNSDCMFLIISQRALWRTGDLVTTKARHDRDDNDSDDADYDHHDHLIDHFASLFYRTLFTGTGTYDHNYTHDDSHRAKHGRGATSLRVLSR